MKSQSPLFYLCLAGLVGILIWYLFFTDSSKYVPQKSKIATSGQLQAQSKKQVISRPSPTPKLAQPETLTSLSVSVDEPAKKSTDPQLELNTAIADMYARMQAGDLVGVAVDYMPPDEWERMSSEQQDSIKRTLQMGMQTLKALRLTPQGQQMLQQLVQPYQAMLSMTPAYNGAGDKAVFEGIPTPDGHMESKTFRKINGRWYNDTNGVYNPESLGK